MFRFIEEVIELFAANVDGVNFIVSSAIVQHVQSGGVVGCRVVEQVGGVATLPATTFTPATTVLAHRGNSGVSTRVRDTYKLY